MAWLLLPPEGGDGGLGQGRDIVACAFVVEEKGGKGALVKPRNLAPRRAGSLKQLDQRGIIHEDSRM